MENLNLYISITLAAPLIMMLLILKGQSRTILAFIIAGIYACLLSGEINVLIFDIIKMPSQYFTINISPIIEETIKAIPVFAFVFALKPKRQISIECAIAMGIGFAIMENVVVLISNANEITLLFAVIRGCGTGMMHGITTMLVGIGADVIVRKKAPIIAGILAALSTACIYHSIYNTITYSQFQYFGIILPLITCIPIIIINIKLYRIL